MESQGTIVFFYAHSWIRARTHQKIPTNNHADHVNDICFSCSSICPGRHIAISCLYLSIATVLSVFRLEKAVDEQGRTIMPSREYISSLIQCVMISLVRASTDELCAGTPRIFGASSNLGPRRQRCWSGLHQIPELEALDRGYP